VARLGLGRTTVVSLLLRWLSRRRFPTLFSVAAAVFVIDFLIPDFVPFADELLLGTVTLLLGSLRKRGQPGESGPGERPPARA
jgi:hypothetical protein